MLEEWSPVVLSASPCPPPPLAILLDHPFPLPTPPPPIICWPGDRLPDSHHLSTVMIHSTHVSTCVYACHGNGPLWTTWNSPTASQSAKMMSLQFAVDAISTVDVHRDQHALPSIPLWETGSSYVSPKECHYLHGRGQMTLYWVFATDASTVPHRHHHLLALISASLRQRPDFS